MDISVALCTFNGEAYLADQLKSIIHQKKKPFEIVICDDGSEDKTNAIIELISEDSSSNIRHFINSRNLHFSGNFFKAASLCSGEYVAFSDQDDLWYRQKLERVSEHIRQSSSELLIHRARLLYSGNNKKFDQRVPDMQKRLYSRKIETCIQSYALGCCFVVHRKLIDLFPEYWKWDSYLFHRETHGSFIGHDMLLFAACWSRRSIELIPDTLMDYRIHEKNLFGRHEEETVASSIVKRLSFDPSGASDILKSHSERLLSQYDVLSQIADQMSGDASQGVLALAETSKIRGLALLRRAKVRDASRPRMTRLAELVSGAVSGQYNLGSRYYGISRLSIFKDLFSLI
jgi:glycosyltransferase involved in cell wall biosynthesis